MHFKTEEQKHHLKEIPPKPNRNDFRIIHYLRIVMPCGAFIDMNKQELTLVNLGYVRGGIIG